MKKTEIRLGICPDCNRETELMSEGMFEGLCARCKTRKINARHRGKEYVPYINLTDSQRKRIDSLVKAQAKKNEKRKKSINTIDIDKEISELKVPDSTNYYQSKAEQKPASMHPIVKKPSNNNELDPLSDTFTFIKILRDCGCEIPEENLRELLDVLVATDKLKDVFMTIAKDDNQQAMLDLEQALNVVERKLQHDWEYNGFQEADDIKFKGFLTWRRVLKGAIFFWKKLYQTNALIEIQRAWNAYTQDPNDKVLLAGDRINSTQKRYQITTESISTIFNTKRPFTRVFYATSQEAAYELFTKWMADRQLHEDKSKTKIVELKSEGEDGRKKE